MNRKNAEVNNSNLVVLQHLQRLWKRDASLWALADTDEPVSGRLGWLDAVPWMEKHVPDIQLWADQLLQSEKFDTVLLLGMGGSSLAAEVYYTVFGKKQGYLSLEVLDSTSPGQIQGLAFDPHRTLILVSSKSGSTVETADLMAWFYDQLAGRVDTPGDHFAAITDPGSALAEQAQKLGFRHTFLNPPDIGGRYSALSFFGLVPAALTGVRLSRLLEHTRDYAAALQKTTAVESRESMEVIQLANLMSQISGSGLNKLVLRLDPEIQRLAVWIEQLVAESTGKSGIGVIPIIEEAGNSSLPIPADEVLVTIGLGTKDPAGRSDSNSLEPDTRYLDLNMHCRHDLGSEFLRWELATALAASRLNINPFDQPDVEGAKVLSRRMIAEKQSVSTTPAKETAIYRIEVPATDRRAGELFGANRSISRCLPDWAGDAQYLAILAWLPMSDQADARLKSLGENIAWLLQIRTTVGFGPRYLHSTGQLHKGGAKTGCFLQIMESELPALAIPGRDYGFDTLHRAQADGDFTVLAEKALPVMRISLKGDRLRALEVLAEELG